MSATNLSWPKRIWGAYTRRLKRDFAIGDADVNDTPVPPPTWRGWEDLLDTLELPAYAAHALTSWVQLQLEAAQRDTLPALAHDDLLGQLSVHLAEIMVAARDVQQALGAPASPAVLALPAPSQAAAASPHAAAAIPPATRAAGAILAQSGPGAPGNISLPQPTQLQQAATAVQPAAAAVPSKRHAPSPDVQPPAKAQRRSAQPIASQLRQPAALQAPAEAVAVPANMPSAPPTTATGPDEARQAGPPRVAKAGAVGPKHPMAQHLSVYDVEPFSLPEYEQWRNAYLHTVAVALPGRGAMPSKADEPYSAGGDPYVLQLRDARALQIQKDAKPPLTLASLQELRDAWLAGDAAARVVPGMRTSVPSLFAVQPAVQQAALRNDRLGQAHVVQGVQPTAAAGPQRGVGGQLPGHSEQASGVSSNRGSETGKNGSNESDGSNQVAEVQGTNGEASQLVDLSTVGILRQSAPTQVPLPPTQVIVQPSQAMPAPPAGMHAQLQQLRLPEARQQEAVPGHVHVRPPGTPSESPSNTSSMAAAAIGGPGGAQPQMPQPQQQPEHQAQEEQQQAQQQQQGQQQEGEQQAPRKVLPGNASRPMSLLNVARVPMPMRPGHLQQSGGPAAATAKQAGSPTKPHPAARSPGQVKASAGVSVVVVPHAVVSPSTGPTHTPNVSGPTPVPAPSASVPVPVSAAAATGAPGGGASARAASTASPARGPGAAAAAPGAVSPTRLQSPTLWPLHQGTAVASATDVQAGPGPVMVPSSAHQQQEQAIAVAQGQTGTAAAQVQAGQTTQDNAQDKAAAAGVEQAAAPSKIQSTDVHDALAVPQAADERQNGTSSQQGASKPVLVRNSRGSQAANTEAGRLTRAAAAAAAASGAVADAVVGTQPAVANGAAAPMSVQVAAAVTPAVAANAQPEPVQHQGLGEAATTDADVQQQSQQQPVAVEAIVPPAQLTANTTEGEDHVMATGAAPQVDAGSQPPATVPAPRRNPARAGKPVPGTFALGRGRASGAAVKLTASQQAPAESAAAVVIGTEAPQPGIEQAAVAAQSQLAASDEVGAAAAGTSPRLKQVANASTDQGEHQQSGANHGSQDGAGQVSIPTQDAAQQPAVQHVAVQQQEQDAGQQPAVQHDAVQQLEQDAAHQRAVQHDAVQQQEKEGEAVLQAAVQPSSSIAAQQPSDNAQQGFSLVGSLGVRGMVDVVAALHPLMQQPLSISWENPHGLQPSQPMAMPSTAAAQAALTEIGVDPAAHTAGPHAASARALAQAAAVEERRARQEQGEQQGNGQGDMQGQEGPAGIAVLPRQQEEGLEEDGLGDGEGVAEEFFDAAELLLQSPSVPMATALEEPPDFQDAAFNTQLF